MIKLINRLSITQKLTLSFLLVILVGSLLLSLPITHYANAPQTHYLDHLFNVISMVCVTGLSVFAVGDVYNGLGQVISMALMQIGGLGLVTLLAISSFAIRRRMNLKESNLLQSALGKDDSYRLKDYLFNVYKITFGIEAIAALILMIDFVPRFGWGHGIFNSIFLAISAFCNAGFDNLGGNSLKSFVVNPLVNLTIAFLIFAGGLGFAVWMDLFRALKKYLTDKPIRRRVFKKSLSIQSKLVLTTTAIVLLAGTLMTWYTEAGNPDTIGRYNIFQQILISFFQTVTMRTAGFATISYTATDSSTNVLYMIQMIMGGAPGGTAGGVKLVVVALLFLLFKAELQGQDHVIYHNRIIASKTIKQTLTILIFFFTVLISAYIILLDLEPNLDPTALLFEAVSAIATVGVSMDLTAKLSVSGRVVIMILMFIGRVGPITVLLSLMQKKSKSVRYASTELTLG
ncbi:TrkH family potassium uptake protein [Streptococcus loxodontisalivarius]|uniref:Potassium uptake TrkH family protein n=1 Tax=Streptococcus loxodontisalivarius TaxID=1349415 RepID=A0ABS2PUJ8_9STRE|nr:potassium transporter TrkG [Streptococcus loxodontisalivarius]MBM7643613.1 potassium uptake TrkH family protein [Streptococcus loxodontisalivarius]